MSNERGFDKFFRELSTYVPITIKLGALILHNRYIYGKIHHTHDIQWVNWLMNAIDEFVQICLVILSIPTIIALGISVLRDCISIIEGNEDESSNHVGKRIWQLIKLTSKRVENFLGKYPRLLWLIITLGTFLIGVISLIVSYLKD